MKRRFKTLEEELGKVGLFVVDSDDDGNDSYLAFSLTNVKAIETSLIDDRGSALIIRFHRQEESHG